MRAYRFPRSAHHDPPRSLTIVPSSLVTVG
jgi:hypothetical protein